MADLLLELFSEEIPARMQTRAAADLERLVNQQLLDAGFMPEGVKGFATPRRLALVVTGLPNAQPDRKEERKGPRVGAPEKAVEGFLKSAGLTSLDQCETREDKKGEFYVALIEEKGRPTAEVIAGFMPEVIAKFPWPKAMRWGDGELRWVRPLHAILCAFDGEIVEFEIDGVKASDRTWGHRFMAPEEIQVRNFEDYAAQLKRAKVVLDTEERKETIFGEAEQLCKAQGLELVEDEGLLNEVAGLAEWPVVMVGTFDEKFLTVPDEALTASMRGHQKYFSVRDPKTGRLANKFVYVANIEAPDGGAAMRTGYERVLTARLSDAWFLYQQDLKTPLAEHAKKLEKVTFFEGLGTVADKVERIAALARELAPAVGADPDMAEKAARLAKADLVTQMVYEFPELQGLMGAYYAEAEGQPAEIVNAIRDHYKPAGQNDDVPTEPVTVAVALADKLDTLTAFWAIGKKPTGSGDPFALRRAALGVIQLLINSSEQRYFFVILRDNLIRTFEQLEDESFEQEVAAIQVVPDWFADKEYVKSRLEEKHFHRVFENDKHAFALSIFVAEALVDFFHDRLKVYLRDKGHAHDHVDAVRFRADGSLEDDIVLIVSKLEALDAFLKTDDGANLTAAYKRAANILKAEEKKGDTDVSGDIDESKLIEPAEKQLFMVLNEVRDTANSACAEENFEKAMSELAKLRMPLDTFFEDVTVNSEDAALRNNRLALLSEIKTICEQVADLSRLEG
ncbi:glycine--tRNA ligase subunit beta [Parvularcula flava]|uniref:Glycine--tRNA ligase beta subunit n=1 Tax=Aquisalinus luteolus TaxID=1566827 RepID=A0A8J3A3Q6_9PROT|nr:glycine--tRNA ligase subunit beta [Aquisalinus luteolus]NHK28932.1 glycine--tRNA ligase subunit beta [Aquisalinus luteolus]GGI00818.1 glycine--tRNA ligase beta subunit [Aquisalinus luteolus]